jgi:uncharacterized membrane protein required for colicin V production
VIVDLILLGLLALAAINGWRTGAIAMLLSIAVLIIAGIGASMFAARAGEVLNVGPAWVHPLVGFLFVFLVVLIAGSWMKRIFTPKHGILRGFDGVAGAVLGFIRGVLVLSLILAVFGLFHLPPRSTTEKSVVYSALLQTSGVLIGVLKPYIHTPRSKEQVPV